MPGLCEGPGLYRHLAGGRVRSGWFLSRRQQRDLSAEQRQLLDDKSGERHFSTPYCSSDDATAALSTTKTVIVIKGPLSVGNLTLNFSQKPVLIAGQSSANLTKPTSGTPPLVNITAGEVTLRDLTIPVGAMLA